MTTTSPRTFRYFAYGSNLWSARMRERCPSARVIGTAVLVGWSGVYDKPGSDGTAKMNIRPDRDGSIHGAIYEIRPDEKPTLDAAEDGYDTVETPHGLAYAYSGEPATAPPADWYAQLVEDGAREHGIPATPRPTDDRGS